MLCNYDIDYVGVIMVGRLLLLNMAGAAKKLKVPTSRADLGKDGECYYV